VCACRAKMIRGRGRNRNRQLGVRAQTVGVVRKIAYRTRGCMSCFSGWNGVGPLGGRLPVYDIFYDTADQPRDMKSRREWRQYVGVVISRNELEFAQEVGDAFPPREYFQFRTSPMLRCYASSPSSSSEPSTTGLSLGDLGSDGPRASSCSQVVPDCRQPTALSGECQPYSHLPMGNHGQNTCGLPLSPLGDFLLPELVRARFACELMLCILKTIGIAIILQASRR